MLNRWLNVAWDSCRLPRKYRKPGAADKMWGSWHKGVQYQVQLSPLFGWSPYTRTCSHSRIGSGQATSQLLEPSWSFLAIVGAEVGFANKFVQEDRRKDTPVLLKAASTSANLPSFFLSFDRDPFNGMFWLFSWTGVQSVGNLWPESFLFPGRLICKGGKYYAKVFNAPCPLDLSCVAPNLWMWNGFHLHW